MMKDESNEPGLVSSLDQLFKLNKNKPATEELPVRENSEDYEHPAQQSASREIRSFHAFIMAEAEENRPVISEYHFVNVFLPFFCGEDKNGITRGNWETVARGYYNKVDVVDKLGNVLFTVPPLLDRTGITTIVPDGSGGMTISDIVSHAHQLTNWHPARGKAFLEGALADRALFMKSNPSSRKYLVMWNKIFTRYHKKPILVPGLTPEELGLEHLPENQEKKKAEKIQQEEDNFELGDI